MTLAERKIVAYANELGYFPSRKQVKLIWEQWSNFAALKSPQGSGSDEFDRESVTSSIARVMNPPLAETSVSCPAADPV